MMNYDNLYSAFKALFPECEGILDSLAKAANADENDGMHIMFSFVVVPFVIELFKKGDNERLSRAFDYFEKMASSDLADVTEVLEFTVIENLMSNGKGIYNKAKTFMGNNMMECCKRVEQFLQVGE